MRILGLEPHRISWTILLTSRKADASKGRVSSESLEQSTIRQTGQAIYSMFLMYGLSLDGGMY